MGSIGKTNKVREHTCDLRRRWLLNRPQDSGPAPWPLKPRMIWIVRRAVDIHRRRALGLVVQGGVTGSANAHEVERFASQRRCTPQFLSVMDVAGLTQPDQAGAATLALVAGIMQRLLPGSVPFGLVIEHAGRIPPRSLAGKPNRHPLYLSLKIVEDY